MVQVNTKYLCPDIRLDCIWADGLVELYLVGQTWSWAKLGLVKFEVRLGWVEFGGDGWV